MGFTTVLVSYIAPLFIVTSPLTSYADQIRNIHVTHSSRGFSLDIPLIMLVASILRCFYWLGADFETSLLIQSLIMIAVQTVLLKVALENRSFSDMSVPFAGTPHLAAAPRPYNFWQWRSQRTYWEFLGYFTCATAVLQLFFGSSKLFVDLLGYIALGIEAALPIPQVLANQKRRSCAGFRFSVLVSWLLGDIMKVLFFFTASQIGLQFKLCAAIQFALDAYLGVQFWVFGDGEGRTKDTEMDGLADMRLS